VLHPWSFSRGGGGGESINPFGSCTLSENCAHLVQVFALVDTDCSSVLDWMTTLNNFGLK
jgi:hypothetical protein